MRRRGFINMPKSNENKNDRYLKLSKLDQGETKIRILTDPIFYWEYWEDVSEGDEPVFNDNGEIKRTPVRFADDMKPDNPEAEYFMSVYIWNYSKKKTFILSIKQKGVLKTIDKFEDDEDFGEMTKYDLKITKKGEGKQSAYTILPMPPKPLSEEVRQALNNEPINLNAMIICKDPWDLSVNVGTREINIGSHNVGSRPVFIGTPLETLKEHLEIDGINIDLLETCLQSIADKNKDTVEKVLENALRPALLPKFKERYNEFLAKQTKISA